MADPHTRALAAHLAVRARRGAPCGAHMCRYSGHVLHPRPTARHAGERRRRVLRRQALADLSAPKATVAALRDEPRSAALGAACRAALAEQPGAPLWRAARLRMR